MVATALREKGKAARYPIVLARQWIGSRAKPLSPEAVFREMAAILRPYGVKSVATDQFAVDANKDLARQQGLYLDAEAVTAARNVELFGNLATHFAQGVVELPPDAVVRSDLLSVRKRVTQSGIAIVLPTSSDGRHADYAPAAALAIDRASRAWPPMRYSNGNGRGSYRFGMQRGVW